MNESPRSPYPRHTFAWAAVVAICAFLPRIQLAWESREDILRHSTPDDAYYYFGIANNIMEGNGASFDSVNVTNGFHPLWQAIITPLWIFNGQTPINLTLSIGALMGALTAAAIFLFLQRATHSLPASLLGAGFFAFHPRAVTDSVNGLESALAVALTSFVLLALMHVDMHASPQRPRERLPDVAFGLLLGALLLARTDMVFIVAAVLIYIAIVMGRARLTRPVSMGIVAAATTIPWFAWSLMATGSLLQISGRAGGVYIRSAYIDQNGDSLSVRIRHGFEVTREVLTTDLPQSYFMPTSHPAWLALLAGALLIALTAYVAVRVRGEYGRAAVILAVISVGFLAALTFHGGVRWFVRTWYFTPAAMLGAAALGLAAHALAFYIEDTFGRAIAARRQAVSCTICALGALAFVVVIQPYDRFTWSGDQATELQLYDGARWLADNTPPGTRAGSFNGGVVGYYSDRTVFNLDGVVNEDAYHAIDACAVREYILVSKLEYIVDFSQSTILAYCGEPVVDYERIAEFNKHPSVYGTVDVLRVVPSTAAQPAE